MLFGNSQQYTVSRAKGTVGPDPPAVPAAELFISRLNGELAGRSYAFFAPAAPNQTFPEALWQAIYWYRVRRLAPAFLILQSSFDTFRKSGIRAGYQTLLEDPGFASAVTAYVAEVPPTAYTRVFTDAEKQFEESKELLHPRGWTVEGELRGLLSHLPLFAHRQDYRGELLNDLYAARVELLHISPTSRRHITGAPFEENWTALRDLIRLARASGTRVLIYNAPVNPSSNMFYAEEYQGYLAQLRALTAAECQGFADLSDAVPAEDWGFWIDAPDPIHFNARGHEILAQRLYDAFGRQMKEAN